MTPTVEITGLTKRYGSTVALDGLDLVIAEGEVLGYLGPNGSGKSTTIAAILGLLRPNAGSVRVFGLDARRQARAIHGRVAYVPSEAALWPALTGAEALAYLAALHGSTDLSYREELIERFELDPDRRIRAYSHGNRQKVHLIAGFASRADLLLLDEPTTGLDPLMEQVFRSCVAEARRRGQTVLLSSHVLSEVEAVCDHVAMLRNGRVVERGELDVLRRLADQRVEFTVAGPPPPLGHVPGVRHVRTDGSRVTCDIAGPIGPLLAVLGDADVLTLSIRQPSLEELFMLRYGSGATAGRDGADGATDVLAVPAGTGRA